MLGRLPTTGDFPDVALTIHPPPDATQPPVSVLLLLHGLGDTRAPFAQLGRQMALPETAVLAVQGPNPVPFVEGGAHWGDDLLFDSGTGDLDPDTGFAAATDLLVRRVLRPLIDACGHRPRDLYLFGFGQGGLAALAAAAALPVAEALGGVVTIGGGLPAACPYPVAKSATPVLALGGTSESRLSSPEIERIRRVFADVQYQTWARPGDAMPGSREEMLPIMAFLARRLQSRQGVPEGAVELA